MTHPPITDDMVKRWHRFLDGEPCLICGGIEGCDHTVRERARAALEAALSEKEE